MRGIKHLIPCRCFLPQFKRAKDPPRHRFIVFSVVDDNDVVRHKLARCNNCGSIHKVVDLTKSEIVAGKEDARSILTIDDIKVGLPDKLALILTSNDADLPTWEQAQFIIENKVWGDFVVLSTEAEDNIRRGKLVQILSETLYKVETFERQEVIDG